MNNFMPEPIKFLEKFITSFQHKTLYILGAGVSKNYVELKYCYSDAKKWVEKNIFATPINIREPLTRAELIRYEVFNSPHTLHKQHNGDLLINDTNIDFYDEILYKFPEVFELICALTYSLDRFPVHCPEYEIFNYANINSQVITLNHDCLAKQFIKKLNVLSLHGDVSPKQKNIIQNNIFQTLELDSRKSLLQELCLATQEDEHILSKKKNLYIYVKN